MNIREQALRYLGWRGQELTTEVERDLDSAINECIKLAQPRFVWRVFDIACNGNEITFQNTAFTFKSSSLGKLLKKASCSALMAATLGQKLEIKLQTLGKTDVSRAVLLDAVASAMIEDVCNHAEREIAEYANKHDFIALPRFSPGYEDWDLSVQPMLLSVLNAARQIGLSCTSANILLPQKSITALVGFLPLGITAEIVKPQCKDCVGATKCGYSSCILISTQTKNEV